ncbi:MAG TPA: tetraacyldisaccharide 4'-kinase [Alphaproteobacteria bacterium]|nr:tetraacyldisaccharide 4'-kinase [Alphaproteobacteria bacterium]
MRAPDFWQSGGALAALLAPAGCLYALGGRWRRAMTTPQSAAMPVICVGNVSAGGTGKTPVVLALAARLAERPGLAGHVHAVTRGYGGELAGPVKVDPLVHDAWKVGDEPLLLAKAMPTWVARDRIAGATAAVAGGARLLLLDDGLQNPALAKDLSFLVVDGGAGFGNGRVIPAGPLREPLADALARSDAAIIVGEDRQGAAQRIAGLRPDMPVLRARLVPTATSAAAVARKPLIAFAGIGRPEKFFESLRALGCDVRAARSFADHHPYQPKDAEALAKLAADHGAALVTTAKDAVRWPAGFGAPLTLDVEIAWADEAALDLLLAAKLGRLLPEAQS